MTNLEYYKLDNLLFTDTEDFDPETGYVNGYTCHVYYLCKHGEPFELIKFHTEPYFEATRDAKAKWLLEEKEDVNSAASAYLWIQQSPTDNYHLYEMKHKKRGLLRL